MGDKNDLMAIVVNFNVNLNLSFPQLIEALTNITNALLTQTQQENDVMAVLDDIRDQVANNGNLINSATTLIRGLADKVAQNINDPAALQQIVDDLRNQDAQLAQAVAENTPADPASGGDTTGGGAGGDTTGGASA